MINDRSAAPATSRELELIEELKKARDPAVSWMDRALPTPSAQTVTADTEQRLRNEAKRDDHRGAGLILRQAADEIATLTTSLAAASARIGELTEALRPFSRTGWMTHEIEHTQRTVVAHMHPEREREIILSSEDFKRARDLLAALSQTEEGR